MESPGSKAIFPQRGLRCPAQAGYPCRLVSWGWREESHCDPVWHITQVLQNTPPNGQGPMGDFSPQKPNTEGECLYSAIPRCTQVHQDCPHIRGQKAYPAKMWLNCLFPSWFHSRQATSAQNRFFLHGAYLKPTEHDYRITFHYWAPGFLWQTHHLSPSWLQAPAWAEHHQFLP